MRALAHARAYALRQLQLRIAAVQASVAALAASASTLAAAAGAAHGAPPRAGVGVARPVSAARVGRDSHGAAEELQRQPAAGHDLGDAGEAGPAANVAAYDVLDRGAAGMKKLWAQVDVDPTYTALRAETEVGLLEAV